MNEWMWGEGEVLKFLFVIVASKSYCFLLGLKFLYYPHFLMYQFLCFNFWNLIKDLIYTERLDINFNLALLCWGFKRFFFSFFLFKTIQTEVDTSLVFFFFFTISYSRFHTYYVDKFDLLAIFHNKNMFFKTIFNFCNLG